MFAIIYLREDVEVILLNKSDYSQDFRRFELLFPSEEACVSALQHFRWPNGFVCPRCNYARAYQISTRRLFQCIQCTYQVSLTSGTVFANTRTSLKKWFFAIYLVSQYSGINAVQLQQALQVTYKTAWLILSKIRYAMNDSLSSSLLSGVVQIDSTTYGQKFHTKAFYQAGEHPVVIGGAMKDNKPTQIMIRRVLSTCVFKVGEPDVVTTMKQFIDEHIDSKVEDVQQIHNRYISSRLRTLRRLVRNTSCWIHRTYRSISQKHLQAYLSEFSFRYNTWYVDSQSSEKTRELLNSLFNYPMIDNYPNDICQSMFTRLIDICSTRQGKTYKDIILNTQPIIRFRRFSQRSIPSYMQWHIA